MDQRMVVHYAVHNQDPYEAAEALRVEQSIEFPNELAPEWIQQEVASRLPPGGGQLLVVGTRVSATDLYKELRSQQHCVPMPNVAASVGSHVRKQRQIEACE